MRPTSCASAARRTRVTDAAGSPMRQAAASASSATPVECSRSHGDLSPVSAAMAMKAASTRSPAIRTCGNGSLSSACSHIRASSSSARSSVKLRTASPASRGSYAAPVRRSTTARASSGPAAERKSEMSLATCRRRIGKGIASPRASGNPRPSQRAKTYSSAAWMLEPRSSHPANRCATSHIVANASRALGPALAMASSIIAARTSGERPAPTWAR